ncbi:hypothetical protein BDW74DRAFT_175120 [Aspergillus multicolor]|uniref:uncharacterized protein n=1 Tax=Aspergillus multicolor TaxID=41759 RepID=UPI003CCE0555
MYYTAERHRPKTFQEFDACTRDAGPRLLDFTKIKVDKNMGLWYLPVSRNFPDLPSWFTRTGEDFVRPAQAPFMWSDLWVEQALYPSDPKIYAHTTVKNYFAFAAKLVSESGLPGGERDWVREAVQRAMIKIAYSGLERHPTAASRDPPRHMLATTPDDLLQTVIWPISAISGARVSEDEDGRLSLDRNGQFCAVKGRGPVYSEDSDVMNCVITVGKLLDAGSTNIDRKDPAWYTQTSQLQRAFIELCDVNWDMCTKDSGADLKEQFRNLIVNEMGDFEGDNPEIIRPLWDMVSRDLRQFMIKYTDHASKCDCVNNPVLEEPKHIDFVPLLDAAKNSEGVKMQELFDRTFNARSFLKLPPRLVVRAPPGVLILGHTEDITVKYRRAGAVSQDESAVYRWLGGIYHDGEGNCRVFWDFTKPGEVCTDQVGMYESSNHGLIIEGSLGNEKDGCKVPKRWWGHGDIPLLFYERVMNPTPYVLTEAVHTVSKMWLEEGRGVLTLKNHKPWANTSDLTQFARDYPWIRDELAKPADARHFQLAPDGYIPEEESSSEGAEDPKTKRSAPKRPRPTAGAEDKESSKKAKQDQPAAPGQIVQNPSSKPKKKYPRPTTKIQFTNEYFLDTIPEGRPAENPSGSRASGPTEPKPEAQKRTTATKSVPQKRTVLVSKERPGQTEAGSKGDDRGRETKDGRERTAQHAAPPSKPDFAAIIKEGLSADEPREKRIDQAVVKPPKPDLATMIKGGLSADGQRESELEAAQRQAEKEEKRRRREKQREKEGDSKEKDGSSKDRHRDKDSRDRHRERDSGDKHREKDSSSKEKATGEHREREKARKDRRREPRE